VILDFSGQSGKEIYLRTNVAIIMQFRVSAMKAADSSTLPAMLRPVTRLQESTAVITR
jgi:spore coat protein A